MLSPKRLRPQAQRPRSPYSLAPLSNNLRLLLLGVFCTWDSGLKATHSEIEQVSAIAMHTRILVKGNVFMAGTKLRRFMVLA